MFESQTTCLCPTCTDSPSDTVAFFSLKYLNVVICFFFFRMCLFSSLRRVSRLCLPPSIRNRSHHSSQVCINMCHRCVQEKINEKRGVFRGDGGGDRREPKEALSCAFLPVLRCVLGGCNNVSGVPRVRSRALRRFVQVYHRLLSRHCSDSLEIGRFGKRGQTVSAGARFLALERARDVLQLVRQVQLATTNVQIQGL